MLGTYKPTGPGYEVIYVPASDKDFSRELVKEIVPVSL